LGEGWEYEGVEKYACFCEEAASVLYRLEGEYASNPALEFALSEARAKLEEVGGTPRITEEEREYTYPFR
jgi:hypothetical protein